MTDAFLHALLGLAIAGILVAAFFLLGPVMAAGMFGAWDIYFREVTQLQGKHFSNDFRRGWNPLAWSGEKNLETFIPVCIVLGVGMAIEYGVQ